MIPSADELRMLLEGAWEFLHPREVLHGITPQDACRALPGCPHTIAQLVAHMLWWQRRRIAFVRQENPGEFALQVDDWPDVKPEDWDGLVEAFFATLAEMQQLADDPEAMRRILFEGRNAGFTLTSHACHNAYHLGQVVLLRRLAGIWSREST